MLNEEFLKNIEAFLRAHPLSLHTKLESANPPAAGLLDFKFKKSQTGTVLLKGYVPSQTGQAQTDALRAYWLPWKSGATTTLSLGTDAKYFFTSALAGCRLQFTIDPFPTVAHIAGDCDDLDGGGFGEEGTAWRDREAKRTLGQRYGDSRRFSSTAGYEGSRLANVVGYFDEGAKRWRLLAQGISNTFDGGLAPLTKGGEVVEFLL